MQGAVSTELSQGLLSLCCRAFSSTILARSDRTHFSPTSAEGALGSDLGMPTAVGCENLSSIPPTLHKQEQTSGSPSPAVCLPLGSPAHYRILQTTACRRSHRAAPSPLAHQRDAQSHCSSAPSVRWVCIYKMCLHSAATLTPPLLPS